MALAGCTLALVACSTPLSTREKGALAGGAIGAGAGAIVGHQVGHTGAGAVIGAGVGAISGAVIGDAIQASEQKAAPPPPAAGAPPAVVVASPPPPPAVVVPPPAPRLIWVPEWQVYVVEHHDVVYYNAAYYSVSGGRWYVSQSHVGPWVLVSSAPPVAVAKLPRGRFHAHLPPGLAKKGQIPPGHAR
jgi:hypothetical protein